MYVGGDMADLHRNMDSKIKQITYHKFLNPLLL